ncbi:MAG: hypothetical protein UY41_C0020G0010 [Candidatus Moranbacteria bacterium GW2011_GWE1_49_15]|nr:MAG: hypothetical protein UX75_C0028G0005 [Candidatus Moranbacteria bacterium GW2011_GWE2_47_10]KKW06589.1 MAG: hypothetical protein UY41_C0020G0010 [Candidatus Moranbacteria bacterium GW2011_GWE1_49_15]HBP01526.1 hypothetical protein [Candidatus Moranbacteria bacterium]
MVRTAKILLLVAAVAVLSGCATGQFQVRNLNLESGVQTLDFLIEPYQSLGVVETDAIKKREVTVFKAVFPEILFGEYFPGRVRWNVLALDKSGREYFGQAVFSGISVSGSFLFTVIMDGKVPAEAKAMVLSTGLEFAYDLGGNEFKLERRKIGDGAYRNEFISANGTKVSDMKRDEQFLSISRKWNRYQTPAGTLLSPLGEKEVKEIAGINPKYSFSEKLVGSGHFTLVADYVGTAASLAIDVMRAPNVPSEGWDYNSQLPSRRNMALIIKYTLQLKQNLIDNINRVNAERFVGRR